MLGSRSCDGLFPRERKSPGFCFDLEFGGALHPSKGRFPCERKYLDAAARFIKAWASTYRTALNPIDDQDFYYFFVANDLVSSDLPPDVKSLVRNFDQQFAQGYLAEVEKAPDPGTPEADTSNPIYKGPHKPDPTRVNKIGR